MKSLAKQQKEVVKPLIAEVTKREKESQILHREVRERTKNLKILFAMIRSPQMCNLFHKTERKRFSE